MHCLPNLQLVLLDKEPAFEFIFKILSSGSHYWHSNGLRLGMTEYLKELTLWVQHISKIATIVYQNYRFSFLTSQFELCQNIILEFKKFIKLLIGWKPIHFLK